MLKYIKKEYIIAAFAGVMGFAAGVATEGGGKEYLSAALSAIADAQGSVILWLALFGMLFNALLYSFAAIFIEPGLSFASCVLAVWIKAFIMGYFCKTLIVTGLSAMTIATAMLTFVGGGAVCAAIFMRRRQSNAKRGMQRSLSMLAAGVIIEGVMIPSALRTIALIVK